MQRWAAIDMRKQIPSWLRRTPAGKGDPKIATNTQLIASHKAALAKMQEMEDGPDAPEYDAPSKLERGH